MRRFLHSLAATPADRAGPARLPLALGLAMLAVMLASSVPFWTGPWLGMVDYPNHLARYFVLTRFDEFPELARYYRIAWAPLPNIGNDAVIVAVHALTGWPSERISQVLVALSATAMVPAVLLLHRALFGGWSWWPLASGLLVLNGILLWGFVNYIAGVPLALALAAAWIMLRDRTAWLLLPLFSAATLLLFFVHLYALGIYGLLVLGHELAALWRRRERRGALLARQALLGMQVLPALLVLLLASPTGRQEDQHRVGWFDFANKAEAVFAALSVGHVPLTLLSFAVLGGAAALGLATRRLVAAPAGLAMLALLAIAFAVMPFGVFGATYADHRLPVALLAVAIAATRWRPVPRAAALAFAAALLALLVLRIGVVAEGWAAANRRYAEIMDVMRLIEPGRRLLVLEVAEDARLLRQPGVPLDHASSLAVIARQSFVPHFFAVPGSQPVVLTEAVRPLAPPGRPMRRSIALLAPGSPAQLAALAAPYDHLLLFALDPPPAALPPGARRIDDGSVRGVALFALRPPG